MVLVMILLSGVLLLAIVLVLAGRASSRRAGGRPTPVAPTITLPAELQSHLRALSVQGQKIQAIKQLREATGLSLLDAKNTVDTIAAGGSVPTPGREAPRSDLAYRARVLAAEGRRDEAVRVVAAETGMSGPEATAFVRALRP
jgi:hypothetical protein